MRRLAVIAALVFILCGVARAGIEVGDGRAPINVDASAPSASIRLAQSDGLVIEAPRRITTDQETVDFSGRVIAPGEARLTVDGIPVAVGPDGSFRIRRDVTVGRSELVLVLEGASGEAVEHSIFVRRTAVAESIDYGTYHALVIGNNEYKHLSDLEMAVADAEAVSDLLRLRYGFEVETLIDATRYEIILAMDRLRAALTENDNLLIYYAGHGSLDIDTDEGYWLPVDAETDNSANWVSNNTITGKLRAIRAKHVLVVADSCYSGKLTRGIGVELRTGAERSAWLNRMNGRRSRTALTSGGLEPVLDAGGGAHSVFAKAFLEALGSNDTVLDGQSLFDAIKRPIVLNADQTPEYADIRKAGHDGGDFLFVPITINLSLSVGGAPAAPASIAPAELALWQAIANSTNVNDYRAYLGAYPAGAFAPLAKIRIDKLGETQTAALVPPPAPALRVDEMDATYVALRTSNIRAAPTTLSDRVGHLSRDDAVAVTGKVADANWYRIEHEGTSAFVFGDLIAPIDPAEQTAWQRIAASVARDEIDGFLASYPDGHYAKRARAKRAALAPPEPAEPEPPPEIDKSADLELAFWNSIKDSNNAADFEAYLQQYPNGKFSAQARSGLAEAERLATEEAQRRAAAEEAAKKLELALLTPPPEEDIDITNADIQNDAKLEKALAKFLNKKKAPIIWLVGQAERGEVESIDEIQLLSVSGSEFKVDVRVTWQEKTYRRILRKRYIATILLYSGYFYTVLSVVER